MEVLDFFVRENLMDFCGVGVVVCVIYGEWFLRSGFGVEYCRFGFVWFGC